MRYVFIVLVSTLGLAGCQTNSGSPGSCVQAGSTVDATVMCPSS